MKQGKRNAAPRRAFDAFPGGEAMPSEDELRVAVDKRPYAEILAHAVIEPDLEVCGVLVGRVGSDAHGPFVHVTEAIRGVAAKEEGAAVTFTHDTWNHIHKEMDQRFPELEIVGWYHTHGGFGVFLSEMDTFVHENFFTGPHHLAYVFDPLAGSEAFFVRKGEALVPVRRYWLGGRERRPAMRAPEAEPTQAPATSTVAALDRVAAALHAASRPRPSTLEGLLPWLVVGGAFFLLLAGWPLIREAFWPADNGPVVILERDPATGIAVGLPLELFEPQGGAAYRDQRGVVRPGVELPSGGDGAGLFESLRRRNTARSENSGSMQAPTPTPTEAPKREWMVGVPWWWWPLGIGAAVAIAAAGWALRLLLRRRRR